MRFDAEDAKDTHSDGGAMEESLVDYSWFVESMERIRDAKDTDEIAKTMMEAVSKTRVEGLDELSTVAVLICEYCASKLLLQKIRRVIANIPKKGCPERSKPWETLSSIAAWFIEDITKDLDATTDLASREGVAWEVAMNVAVRFLQDIDKDVGVIREELATGGEIN